MLMFPNIVAFLFFPNCQKQDFITLTYRLQTGFAGQCIVFVRAFIYLNDIFIIYS